MSDRSPTLIPSSELTGAIVEFLGHQKYTCRICGVTEPLEWEYQRKGACSDCARMLGNLYATAHGDGPLMELCTTDEWDAVLAAEAARKAGTYRKKPIPQGLRMKVFERDGFRCQTCGRQENLEADHVDPERHGGDATLENLQTLCKSCNSRKGARRRGSSE